MQLCQKEAEDEYITSVAWIAQVSTEQGGKVVRTCCSNFFTSVTDLLWLIHLEDQLQYNCSGERIGSGGQCRQGPALGRRHLKADPVRAHLETLWYIYGVVLWGVVEYLPS